jgi:hypothetical protein
MAVTFMIWSVPHVTQDKYVSSTRDISMDTQYVQSPEYARGYEGKTMSKVKSCYAKRTLVTFV